MPRGAEHDLAHSNPMLWGEAVRSRWDMTAHEMESAPTGSDPGTENAELTVPIELLGRPAAGADGSLSCLHNGTMRGDYSGNPARIFAPIARSGGLVYGAPEITVQFTRSSVFSSHSSKMKEIPVPPSDSDIFLSLSSQIVSAYVAKNAVDHESLPALIRDVRAALTGAAEPPVPVEEPPIPAVDPKRSVFRDHIVCLEDGQKMRMLRRHLQTAHGMTPNEYRQRWGLPGDYPMAAPSYAAMRSAMAKEIGLGRKPADAAKPTLGASVASKPAVAAEGTAETAPEAVVEVAPAEPSGKAAGEGKHKGRQRAKGAPSLKRRSPRAKG